MQPRAPGGSLAFLSQPRQTLLVALKNSGEATTEQLARETFLSPGAVRQHLLALEAQGLVSFVRVREGPGRPRHVFRLTAKGERLFPQLYAEAANTILSAVEAEAPAILDRVIDRLVEEQVQMAGDTVRSAHWPERLLELVQFIERFGYYPRLEVADGEPARLTLNHCPLLSLASRHPDLCRVECEAMRRVLGSASVTRVSHRLQGDAVCTYVIASDESGSRGA